MAVHLLRATSSLDRLGFSESAAKNYLATSYFLPLVHFLLPGLDGFCAATYSAWHSPLRAKLSSQAEQLATF